MHLHQLLFVILFTGLIFTSTSAIDLVDLTGCGKDKGCFRKPDGCLNGDCDILLTWKDAGDQVLFEMEAKTSGYFSLGFNDKGQMSGADVIDCIIKVGSAVEVGTSKNSGYSNAVQAGTDGITVKRTEYLNGRGVCVFSRSKNAGAMNLNSPKFFLLAKGGQQGQYHTRADRHFTGEPVIISAQSTVTDAPGGSSTSIMSLMKAHACLMVLAWSVFAAIGILTARHMKMQWKDSTIFGKAIWFRVHQFCMVLCFTCTVVAIILIFVAVKAWSDTAAWEPSSTRVHPILGLVVLAIVVINPTMAFFRPSPDSSNRVYFNYAHWFFGVAGYVIGIVTIFLGIASPIGKAIAPDAVMWLMVAHVAVWVLVDLILELQSCIATNSGQSNSMEMTATLDKPHRVQTVQQETRFRKTLYLLFVVTIVGLGVATVAVIALAK